MHNPTGSVRAIIKRILRITDEQAAVLMPGGEYSPAHFVGGYMQPDSDDVERMRREDEEGWEVIP